MPKKRKQRRWGFGSTRKSQYVSPLESNHRGGEVDDRTFGNVWTRIWRNRDAKGRLYYSFTQHRVYKRYEQTKLSRTFLSEDPDDIIRGAMWAAEEIHRREMHELSSWEENRHFRRESKHARQVAILKRKHARK